MEFRITSHIAVVLWATCLIFNNELFATVDVCQGNINISFLYNYIG